jgi:hypothetical protein
VKEFAIKATRQRWSKRAGDFIFAERACNGPAYSATLFAVVGALVFIGQCCWTHAKFYPISTTRFPSAPIYFPTVLALHLLPFLLKIASMRRSI